MTETTAPILRLPEPALVVLVGAAGSGKSTLATRLFAPDEVLSSDAFRAAIAGDAANQRVTKTAFAILNRQLDRRLATGLTTVVDATSVTPFARRGLLRRAAVHRIPAIALVLDLDPEVVLARNAARDGRVVPEPVVRQQLADLARSLRAGNLAGEGFHSVHVIRTPGELDGLQREPVRR